MAAIAGYGGKVTVNTNVILTVTDWTMNIAEEMYDITSLQNIRAKSFVPGLYDTTIDAKLNWDASDTNGVIALQNAILAGTGLTVLLSTNNATNTYTMPTTGSYVKTLKINDPVNNKVSADVQFQVSGAPSYA